MPDPGADQDEGGDAQRQAAEARQRRPRAQFGALNDDINGIVARRGARPPADLVPEVEAAMRRHGVTPPSLEGILQWIDESIAAQAATHRD